MVVSARPSSADPQPAAPQPVSPPPLSDFDEPLEPFVPKVARTSDEEDRLEALSQFAAGRMLEQQQEFSAALRHYERAHRLDASATPVVQAIVQLAFSLQRNGEAVRYARKLADMEGADPAMLERLAAHVTSQGDLAEAIKLYRRAIDLARGEPNTPQYVLLNAALAELLASTDAPGDAADAVAIVRDALADPEKFGIGGRMKRQLAGKSAAATQQRFGQVFLAAGRLAEARAAFEKAQELDPNPARNGLNLAELDLREDHAEQGLAHLDAYLAAHESSAGARPYVLLGELLAKLDRRSELVGRLEQAQSDDAENLALNFHLAGQYAEQGADDRAIALHEKILAEKPTTDGFTALAGLYRKGRRAEDLLRLLSTCIEKSGDLRPLGDELAAIAGEGPLVDAVLAAADARHAAEQPDGLAQAGRQAAARLALAAKRADEARRFFELAASTAPADELADLYKDWGFGLMQAEDYAGAVAVYQEAIEKKALGEDRPDFHFMLAGPLEMLEKTDEALAAAREAVARAERNAESLGDMVFLIYPRVPWVSYHAKRYSDARQGYEDLIRRFDSVHTSTAAREVVKEARFALSNIGVQENDYAQAEEWLEQVLDEYPDDVGALNDLGYLWAEQNKNLRRALPMIQKAVEAQPENRAYRDSLGWVYFQLGRHAEAIAELELAAASKEKPDGVIFEHLGDAYHKAGRVEDARGAWRQSIAAFEQQGEPSKRQAVAAKLERAAAEAGSESTK